MCGLCGAAGPYPEVERLRRATRLLDHRGPDDTGTAILEGPIFLGHTRLSIIDLSPAGHQPMSNEDSTVAITYNGEIYNFLELREALLARGHRFRSNSDTEVILHGYEEWGIDELLRQVNGMFAFALADTRRSRYAPRLILARDRVGIKPLYYLLHHGVLGFASEIKALLAMDLLPREVDWQAVYDYFSFMYVPNPRTSFRGISQLPPGHYLTFAPLGAPDERSSLVRYWNPLDESAAGPGVDGSSAEAWQAEIRRLLEDAVARQLVSDVPLGVFLSGGIDSTILTALAASRTPGRLKTFTVRFEGAGAAPHDDTEYARRVSRHYDTEHHELVVSLSDPGQLLEMVSCFDQPFANPTSFLSYLISRETRSHVTVALSGAGGDELFGGYPRYRALRYASLLTALPEGAGRAIRHALRLLPENHDRQTVRRIKLLARGIGREFPEQFLRWTYFFADEEKRRLLSPLLARIGPFDPSVRFIEQFLDEAGQLRSLPDRVQYLELNTFLVDNILEYTDKTSMAVSLEVRVPFLDHRFVELSMRVPWKYKIRNGRSKYILVEAFRDLIPGEIWQAPKRGFCPPLATWMEQSLDGYFDVWMGPQVVKRLGVFDWETIQRLRADHRNRRRDNSMELFGIMMFESWYRRYISSEAPIGATARGFS